MNSHEITEWLRSALTAAGATDASRLSSHSLKATFLTWASLAGVVLDLRRLLAHHVHDSARSTETYSRNVLIPAARALDLEEVLKAIRDEDFMPDTLNPKPCWQASRQHNLNREELSQFSHRKSSSGSSPPMEV